MKNLVDSNGFVGKDNLISNFKGIVISFALTLILLFVFAIVLTYTNMQESTIAPVIIVISVISILIGSSIGASKIRKNGLIYGGIMGFIYIGSIYIISSITQTGFNVNVYSIVMIVLSILAGMIRWNCRSEYEKR